MKNIILLLVLCFSIVTKTSFAQEEGKKFEPSGNAIITIFTNYHYDFTNGVEKKSQFELQRAYFGYAYNFSEQFSTRLVLDVGYNETVDSKDKSSSSYAVFLKFASLEWKMNDNFKVEGGMIPTHIFDLQEKFYGYRYILQTVQDRGKDLTSADLGVKASFKPDEIIEFHAGIWNGDGYKNIQDSYGMHKASVDFVLRPFDGLVFKTYFDVMSKKDTLNAEVVKLETKELLNFFLGYEKKEKFRVGVEYASQYNSEHIKDQLTYGVSTYGSLLFNKFEVLARYDNVMSNTLPGETEAWNVDKDYSLILGGVQYAPVKGVKMALNYRHFIPKKSGSERIDMLYLNFEFRI
jgi:hypothetical protein